MLFVSTRNTKNNKKTLSYAIQTGLADDGGLFIPETFPHFNPSDFPETLTYPLLCQRILEPFFAKDPLENKLPQLCQEAFNFKIPLKPLSSSTYLLELFHGPTLSFKDFGARFLANCLSTLTEQNTTIIVATSGDTGSAVAAAFHNKPKTNVIILFPNNKISSRQQQQITCWGDNIQCFAVNGSFDDCQRMVKASFKNRALTNVLCTANSINIGRLLPQVAYYAHASLALFRKHGVKTNFVVPSGNFGNVTAAFWAKKMGFPILAIRIATNANHALQDFLKTGTFTPHKSIQTLANAMDVGNPSNFERLQNLFPDYTQFKNAIKNLCVSNAQIEQAIQSVFAKYKTIICPHTATAYWMREQRNEEGIWAIVSTAHPCKFETIIEPIIHQNVPVDSNLLSMLQKKSTFTQIKPNIGSLRPYL